MKQKEKNKLTKIQLKNNTFQLYSHHVISAAERDWIIKRLGVLFPED